MQKASTETCTTELTGLNQVERKAAPRDLYCRGEGSLLSSVQPRVAIIGSRNADENELELAYTTARSLAARGVIIVSGLARGVDTAAHQGAIDANGKTIAVLGAGFSHIYPPENKELFQLIGQEHLLLTQFAPDKPPLTHNFPMRNRLMALIADATAIVTATETSGTRHQAWEAIRLNRLVLINGALLKRQITWMDQLLSYGAESVALPDGLGQRLEQHGLISRNDSSAE